MPSVRSFDHRETINSGGRQPQISSGSLAFADSSLRSGRKFLASS
jgi:hypothetical protein